MKSIIILLLTSIPSFVFAQSIEKNLPSFSDVMIGPGINIEFIKSNAEKVYLVSTSELIHDLFIDVENGTLKIYFDHKDFSFDNDNTSPSHGKYSLNGTPYEHVKVYAKVYFVELNNIDFRGEEKLFCKDKINTNDFTLKSYGTGEIKLAEVNAMSLKIRAYGENEIKIIGGSVEEMKITCYGLNEINTQDLKSRTLKITSYGESELKVYAVESLNIKVIGEGSIQYAGDPKVKEFSLGEATVSRLP